MCNSPKIFAFILKYAYTTTRRLVAKGLPHEPVMGRCTAWMFALPAPYVLPVFAATGKDEHEPVSSALSAMTLMALAVFGGIAFIAR